MNPRIGPIIREAEQLDNRALDALITNMISLRTRRVRSSSNEARLLARINKGLPVAEVQRMHTLNAKRTQEMLSDAERNDLYALVEKTEKLTASRLNYLTQLARLRNVPVRDLMNQLGILTANG